MPQPVLASVFLIVFLAPVAGLEATALEGAALDTAAIAMESGESSRPDSEELEAVSLQAVGSGTTPAGDPRSEGVARTAQLAFKLDHFGYRPLDPKLALVTTDPGPSVAVRRLDGSVAFRIPADGGSIVANPFDGERSGDTTWSLRFDELTATGTYTLHTAALGDSYPFRIADDVYNDAVRTAARAFYLQRCGTPKLAQHAGDWSDAAACHTTDTATGPGEGQVDRGLLDLSGGWHDAGDYNKYAWGAVADAVWSMLSALEDNPAAFPDGALDIPESGNGLPDLLDEVRWELDWLLKMQLADGSVLEKMREPFFESSSPPSTDAARRFYFDPDTEAAAVLMGSAAIASRRFAASGESAYAETLKTAALASWAWLQSDGEDPEMEVWAAAELYRLDPTQTAAKSFVETYRDWSNTFFDVDRPLWRAALAYLQATSPDAAVAAGMRSSFANQVDRMLAVPDPYEAGMFDFQYYWGSNRPRALYGFFLLQAAKLGETGAHSEAAVRDRARAYLHYLHGRNTLNMLYLSQMAAFGGEHSSFQIYHAWFGDSRNSWSTATYLGKPAGVVEPAYPYFVGTDNHGVSDAKVSTLGPAPGFVPGGPNDSYGDTSTAPSTPPLGAVYRDRFYRDWADQAVWTAVTWEITEPSISYQGPYVALGLYFLETTTLFQDDFESGTLEAWAATSP